MPELRRPLPLAVVCLAVVANAVPSQGQTPVRLEGAHGEFRLMRDGAPYTIHGVGGDASLKLLAACGGNSIRTWGADRLDTVLDEAQRQGLTVCVGLWLGHERHGFDYQDDEAVLRQLEDCLAVVRAHKDHPAVLLWGVGNEMEGDGHNPAVWYAVDHIAREIKRIDPHHPTMTAIAELGEGGAKVRGLERFCPHIDIIGVNSYGGAATLPERYREAGGSKPYILTEHGPHGPWEVGKSDWGAPLEATSTAKGAAYAESYRRSVVEQRGTCLGSYAFLWGHKQETTATWFGMLLPDGSRLAPVDALTESWTGKPPANRCPRIESLTVEGTGRLKPGQVVQVTLDANDPERDPLAIRWVLRHDSVTIGAGGDAQAEESTVEGVVAQELLATVTAPAGGGAYRLFAYIRDGQGGAAVANVPLFVDAPVRPIPAPRAELPSVVYGDDAPPSAFIPSGFMGNTKSIRLSPNHADNPHSGKSCLKVEYLAADDWGGVLWQSPPDDWEGQRPGGLDLRGAVALEFWVRGDAGGETVNFMLGVVDGDRPYRDTAKAELKDVRLTSEWQRLRFPLAGRDLSRIKTGFGWSLAGQGRPVTFYLDDIRYVAE